MQRSDQAEHKGCREPQASEQATCTTAQSQHGPQNSPHPAASATQQARPTAQDREHYMSLALEEARKAAELGEVPVGAVVVHEPYDPATRTLAGEPRIVARAHNLRETQRDASAHAELLAMREAMAQLDAWRLSDCTVYVTLEPCLMCAGLMQQARVAACVFGAYDPKGGALASLYQLNDDERLNHSFAATGGIMEGECSQVLKDFFAARRAR